MRGRKLLVKKKIIKKNSSDLIPSLESVFEERKSDSSITLTEICNKLSDKGFGILLILFSFPMAIPFPYPPGLTTILGTPLLFFSVQLMLGYKKPWIPKLFGKQKIKVSHIKTAVNKTIPVFKYLEKMIHERMTFMLSQEGEIFIGFISFLCSISIILPILFGNAIPSLGILIMALGILYKDGLTVIIGILTSIIGLIVATLVVVLGIAAIKYLLSHSFNFIYS